jgi:hypothetical protein
MEVGLLADEVNPGPHVGRHMAAVRSTPEPDLEVALRCSAVAF